MIEINVYTVLLQKTLYLAAFFGHTDTCAVLIDKGANIDEPYVS